MLAYEKVRLVAEYQQKCYLTGNNVVSFSDAMPQVNFRLGLAAFLRQEYDTVRVPDLRYAQPVLHDGSCRWCNDYRDFYWTRNYHFQNDPPEAQRVYHLRQAQQFIATVRQDGHAAACVKGGHNGEPHNHNDVGSIIYHVDGDSLLADLGRGKYCKQYFGEERYTFLCNGSQGHSLPIVAGGYQQPGAEHRASGFAVEEEDGCYRVSMGLEAAYAEPRLRRLQRSLRFDKADGSLTISDHCEASEALPLTSRFVTKGQVELAEEGRVVITGEQAKVELRYDAALCSVLVGEDDMDPHNGASEKDAIPVFLIDLTVRQPAADQTIVAEIRRI